MYKALINFLDYKIFFMVVSAMFGLASLNYAINNSWFLGQDFDHLVLLQSVDFVTYLGTSIDIHFPLPLHRLACWFFFDVAGMNYPLATFSLIATHLAGAWYLYKILYTLKPSPLAVVLATIYSVNFYVLDLFTWWSAGLHRFPYLLLSFVACYHALKIIDAESVVKHVVIILIAQILAFGFFEKGAFVPVYLALMLALQYAIKNLVPSKAQLVVVVISLTMSVAYFVAAPHPEQAYPDIRSALIAGSNFFAAYLQSLSPLPYRAGADLYVFLIYAGFAAFSIIKKPKLLIVMACVVVAVCVNIIPLAYSSRVTMFGTDVLLIHRYFFDMLFLLIILIYVVILAVFEIRGERINSLGVVALVFPTALYAFFSFSESTPIVTRFYSDNNVGGPAAAGFIKNISDSVEMQSRELGRIDVLDRVVPQSLYVPFGTPDIKLSQILRFSGMPLKFADNDPDFHILDDGRLVRAK